MKKILPILTALTLVATPVYASDLSSMSDTELTDLLNQVRSEMANRQIGENDIHAGTYVVGTDIKADYYTFTAYDCDRYVRFMVFDSQDKYNAFQEDGSAIGPEYTSVFTDVDLGDSIDINLKDDMVMIIKYGSCYVETANLSWAP